MSHEAQKAKPGRWNRPGFAQSTWRLVAILSYRTGAAGANPCLSLLPLAVDGAGYGAALLWGGLSL